MPLWGMNDNKSQSNTATASITVTAANATVVGVNTKLSTDFEVGDYLNVGDNNYVFTALADATVATVRTATVGSTLKGAQSNAVYYVQDKPMYITYATGAAIEANNVYGVSTSEMAANTGVGEHDFVTHAGWNLRTAGTGGRAGRVFYETLVAASSISGDAGDDTKLPE